MKRKGASAAVGCGFALACLLNPPTTTSSAQQSPTFRAAIDYVEADVVVTDRQDRVVRDLTRDEFEVRLDGRAQKIVTFRVSAIAPAERKIDVITPTAPFDVAGNEVATTGRQFVLVIDNLHILPQHIPETRRGGIRAGTASRRSVGGSEILSGGRGQARRSQ